MSRRIALINQKGGSGKTTTAVNLAAALSDQGHDTLVVDCNPQAAATWWLGGGEEGTLLDVLNGDGATLSRGSIDLLPACNELARAEITHPDHLDAWLSDRGGYNFIFFDCPPHLGDLSILALMVANEAIIPTRPEAPDLQGVSLVVDAIETARQQSGDLQLTGVLLTQVRPNTKVADRARRDLRDIFGDTLFDTEIRINVRLAEAYRAQEPITEYAPDSAGAGCYRALADELTNEDSS